MSNNYLGPVFVLIGVSFIILSGLWGIRYAIDEQTKAINVAGLACLKVEPR